MSYGTDEYDETDYEDYMGDYDLWLLEFETWERQRFYRRALAFIRRWQSRLRNLVRARTDKDYIPF